MAELGTLLEPGRAVQFNARCSWTHAATGYGSVASGWSKARAAGAPIDGLVISAGIPELEESVELIDELHGVGIAHVCFKPGTVEQIRAVIRIAAEAPAKSVIAHIEGGRAGGHHSWEDLDDLLLTTYSELRSQPNLTVCVGGGVGTPRRAADYLTAAGRFFLRILMMPVDAALLEHRHDINAQATTSRSVKQLLVDTVSSISGVGAGKITAAASGHPSTAPIFTKSTTRIALRLILPDDVAGDQAVAGRARRSSPR